MNIYNIFIDESGTASPKDHQNSPYFCLAGVLINDLHGEKLKMELDQLKMKYFGRKGYILHAKELRYHLKMRGKTLAEFSNELNSLLDRCYFSLLYVVVNKERAFRLGYDSTYIYQQTYIILLSNMLKFLCAKGMKGHIFAEASNANQDSHLYSSFFQLIRRGISRLSITHEIAREHLTCLSFVTKPNNDPEEQITDLFGIFGRIKMEIDSKIRKYEDLDEFEKVIYSQAQKRLFTGANAKLKRKKQLYSEINSFKMLP